MSFQVGIGSLSGTVFFQVGLCTPLQTMAWKCVSTAIFGGMDISEVPGCHLSQQMSSH